MNLDQFVIDRLRCFPHRTDQMADYAVCRDWLKKVLQETARHCVEIAEEQLRESRSVQGRIRSHYIAAAIRREFGLEEKA